jgi:hypothetical protein
MGWQDLLAAKDVASVVSPWLGGRRIQLGPRVWHVDGQLPEEYGWYKFKNYGKRLTVEGPAEPQFEPPILGDGAVNAMRPKAVTGYVVGDHFVPDGMETDGELAGRVWCPFCRRFLIDPTPDEKGRTCGTCFGKTVVVEPVYLLEEGIERFARVSAMRMHTDGPLIYYARLFELGPESDVTHAYEDQVRKLDAIKGVTPALEAAFAIETWTRDEAERRRREVEERRRLEAERLVKEQRRQELIERLGDAQSRRELAKQDFGEAARAALAVGGATYLDHRRAARRNEYVVRFRFRNRRFECTCDDDLAIIDSGICLIDHGTGEKGDAYFTLESLPSVIKEADDAGRLVVFRHVN